ncbi:hypothetical protein PPERSA_11051 [Pseudocohnilembus persalinus]|uniref:Tubulin-tyrosine ligase family protein n=1 Tax=Pseudocohnilembus persalinus TaxID=266149 RepID=A0A0V0QZ42_PSEPJ|nr:hypothetical protein PPERSA_11051 [Pseudocohnilembus persalinus]|eukprot:KRX07502.1 hypothetical protein PPERSA_11051 [Pseudocohnilembus persalinus]
MLKTIFLILILIFNIQSVRSWFWSTEDIDNDNSTKYNLCYRNEELNQITISYFHNDKNWNVKQIYTRADNQIMNEEFIKNKCNFVDYINNYKSKDLLNEKNFLYNFPQQDLKNIPYILKNDLFNLDLKQIFKHNYNSKIFSPLTNQNLQDKNLKILKQQNTNDAIILKSYSLLLSSQPQLVFYKNGYIQIGEQQKQQKNIDELEKIINAQKQNYQQIHKKIEQLITYTMLSQYQKLQQSSKIFLNFEFTIGFYFNQINNQQYIELEPYLISFNFINMLSNLVFTTTEATVNSPKFQFLQNYIPSVLDLFSENFNNFQSFKQLPQEFSKINYKQIENKYGLKIIINQSTDYIKNLETNESKSIKDDLFEKKYWICMIRQHDKIILVEEFIRNKKPNWVIKKPAQLFLHNLQNCDIIYSHGWVVGGIGIPHIDYDTQLWNQTPQIANMHNKAFFYNLLLDYDKISPYTFNSTYFFPKTYVLNFTSNYYQPQELEFLAINQTDDKNQWIYKPINLSKGRGIRIYSNISEAQTQFIQDKELVIKNFDPQQQLNKNNDYKSFVVQKYIRNTKLLENKKFDIRCYMVVAWTEPEHQLILFHPGYVRRSLTEYKDEADADYGDIGQHLTNHMISIEKYEPEKDIYKNQTLCTIQGFKNHIIDKHGLSEKYVENIIYEMKKVVAYSAEAYIQKLSKHVGHFQFFGMDIMFDENWNPFLVEANANPQVYIEGLDFKDAIGGFVESIMELETYLMENRENANQLIKEQTQLPLGNLDILINKANGYNILNEFKKDSSSQNQKVEQNQQNKQDL